jgi:hypothetical protein
MFAFIERTDSASYPPIAAVDDSTLTPKGVLSAKAVILFADKFP